MADEYKQIKNPDDIRAAFRRTSAIDAERGALFAEADLDAVNRLRDTAQGHPLEVGIEAQGAATRAPEIRAQAEELKRLAGVKDPDLPWASYALDFKNKLGEAEEIHLRAVDQADHPDAYGMDTISAEFNLLRAQARLDAYNAKLAEIEGKTKPPSKRAKTSASAETESA